MDFVSILSIFVMACFVGYYVVWMVTPLAATPLMAVTAAIRLTKDGKVVNERLLAD
jgi:H+-translocating NAD(P) transhydrogenase subunit alpha